MTERSDQFPAGKRSRGLRRTKATRRITGGLALLFALVAMGFAY